MVKTYLRVFLRGLNFQLGGSKDQEGQCYKVHKTIESISNFCGLNCEGYYNSDHIITKVNEEFYDIGGLIMNTEGYLPFSSFGEENIRESFKQYL